MAAEKTYDLIVIGSGPGGYVAAVRGAQLGLKVACVEKGTRLGGVCLNVGCIPSKALLDSSEYFHLANAHFAEHGIKTGEVTLDLPAMMARKDKVVEALTDQVRQLLTGNSVDIVHAEARLSAPGEVALKPVKASGDSSPGVLKGRSILLATGSEPVSLPGMDFDGESIVSSTEALDLGAVPEHLGIVGGGYIGLEMGSVWNRLGARVSVIEMLPKIAATLDGQVARTLDRLLRHQGLDIRAATRVVEARQIGGKVEVTVEKDGKTETLSFDKLLVSVGRRPLTRGLGLAAAGVETDAGIGQVIVDGSYRTSAPGVYAVGDLIAGPMLAHKASAEGTAAVEIIAGRAAEVNYDAIPAVVYTWPEVAGVGLTEEEAKSRGIPYCVGSFPFSGTGRARCMGEKDGFVKLISHSRTDRVLGAHIIGPRASDMIAECVLAMEFGASAEDIARTVHGHPTFAEALQEAAMTATKCSIYTS